MPTPFLKMHGCGNDFVVLDARAAPLDLTVERAAGLADRRRGIGCDQLITLEPPPLGADVFMRIRNPDGSEVEACGNATRCVAVLLARETGRRRYIIRTLAGDLCAEMLAPDRVAVDMGVPGLGWRAIPLAEPRDTLHLDIRAGMLADPAAASMGNPHATFFVDDVGAVPIETLGPGLEHDPIFPERANIGIAQVLAPDRIRLRVWERTAGLTLACGSAACAALVNAHRRGLTGRLATMVLDGGELVVEWLESGRILMTGPVSTAYTGTVDLDTYPR
ncbi:MAG TPA: diaminopimelate epimerase [Acetobacteraceae bacterium]